MVSYEIRARKRRATKAALHGSDESLLETAAQYLQCCIGAPRRLARKARGAPRTRRTQATSNAAGADGSAPFQYGGGGGSRNHVPKHAYRRSYKPRPNFNFAFDV